jgi:uncharacterized membrane protein
LLQSGRLQTAPNRFFFQLTSLDFSWIVELMIWSRRISIKSQLIWEDGKPYPRCFPIPTRSFQPMLRARREIMLTYILMLLVGIVTGLRALIAPAALSWAAHLGVLDLSGTFLAFLGYRYTPWVLSLLAVAELITDQLPSTPSRTVPQQFATRILLGALAGATIGVGNGASHLLAGAILGALGAVIGTLGGAAARARLAANFRRDRPAALIEDTVAIGGAALIVGAIA